MEEYARNPLEQLRQERVASDAFIDLVNSNFGAAGISPPNEWYGRALQAWREQPQPQSGVGPLPARAAIAAFYAAEGRTVDPGQLVLTAGSSVSYHLIFATLAARLRRSRMRATHMRRPCVLLPQPGYPLFEGILAPLGITPRWYRCRPERDFLPDPQEISAALTHASPHEPVTAVVVISPNNPCGVTYPAELMHEIAAVCDAAGVALIVDEVFSGLADGRTAAWHPGSGAPVTFVLNGLSKLAAAPDVKLGWIVVDGGDETHRLVDELDTIHDTYLTVSGFASAAPHSFLVGGEAEEFRRVIRKRVSQTRGELQRALAALPGWEPAPATSGIHLPVRIAPRTAEALWGTTDDEEIAIALLHDYNIYLHPGYFYSLDEETVGSGPWLVVTALHAPGTVATAVRRLQSLHS